MKYKQKAILICDGSACQKEIEITVTVKQTSSGRREVIQTPKHWSRMEDHRHLCTACKERYLNGLE